MRIELVNKTPFQQPSSRKIQRNADIYWQRGYKFDGVALYHSYEELLFSTGKQAQANVPRVCPQPFKVRIDGKDHFPDLLFEEDHVVYVAELKPDGKFDAELQHLLVTLFLKYDMKYIFVSNESVREKETQYLNCLLMQQEILRSSPFDATLVKKLLWSKLSKNEIHTFRNLVSTLSEFDQKTAELAIFSSYFEGLLDGELNDKPLSQETKFWKR